MTANTIQGVKVIEARGSHRKIGETIGAALRPELQKIFERAKRKGPDNQARARIRERLAVAEQVIPGVLEEIRGLEQGAGLPPDFLMAEWAENPRRSAFPDACSNVVFKDGPDGPLWGKNNDGDWNEGALRPDPCRCILKIYPDDGIPVMTCTYIGWLAGDLLNAEGVATGGSSGASQLFQSPYDVPELLWSYAGMQKARTAGEFARHITSRPVRGKGYLSVAVDRHGAMFAAETVPPLVQLRPLAGWMRGVNCTNFYQMPLLKDISGRGHVAEAEGRSRYLDSALREGDLSLAFLKSVLRHHGENDICRHGRDRHDLGFTEFSTIGVCRERKLLFCNGNPCQGEYEPIEF